MNGERISIARQTMPTIANIPVIIVGSPFAYA
jgi:hypothetical protein